MELQVFADSFHPQCHLESTVSERCFQNDFNELVFFPDLNRTSAWTPLQRTSTVYYIYLRRVEAVASVASNHENRFDNMTSTTSVAIKLMELLKLIRLLRMKEILTSSNVIRDLQQRNRSYILLTAKYVFLIMVTSHWFACIWCFTVYSQVKSFDEDDLLENPNWLTYWHSNYYSEGGLNPFGWENDLSR